MRLSFRVCLALGFTAVVGSAAAAQTYNFGYSGTVVSWVVPASGSYFLEAIGAQGGSGVNDEIPEGGPFFGGLGADIGGVFNLTSGDILQIAVGGMGSSGFTDPNDPQASQPNNGGGGGGSFIALAANNPIFLIQQDAFATPLIVAGGGGGIRSNAFRNGCDASTTVFATTGSGTFSGAPGQTFSCALKATGSGVGGVPSHETFGGGGAGYYGNGAEDLAGVAQDWANGLAGGAGAYVDPLNPDDPFVPIECSSAGGFGGGGSGTGCDGGGGGGGYSGGDGGYIAGGGGSYNGGFTELKAVSGVGYGDGSVTISKVPDVSATPEPATIFLMGTGILAIALMRKRKQGASS